MYEPIHGTAPDIAGQGRANPLAAILSTALLLRYSLGLTREALAVERAVRQAIERGYRTADIMTSGAALVTTREMGEKVVRMLLDND